MQDHSDLKIEEGESLLALIAGIRPAAKDITGVAIKMNKRASMLSLLGRVFPKKAALKAAWPCIMLKNQTR